MLVRAGGVLISCVLLAPSAAAQGHRSGEMFIAARVGANLVGNTYRVRESKPVLGAGFSGGVFLSPYWIAELEWWTRSSNPDCCAGRERLYSLSAERLYARIGLQPYLAGGLTLLRTQAAGGEGATQLQIQVTAGVRVPVASRLAVDLDLRGNGGGSTMIVRPTVAAVYFFN